MKSIYAILGSICLQSCLLGDKPIYLAALAQIESGGNDKKIGARGERSQYQLMPSVWRAYNKGKPFSLCHGRIATLTARDYVYGLETRLTLVLQSRPSPAQFYCAWNMGFAGFKRRGFLVSKCPAAVQERAERFANLVTALKEEAR